MKKYLNKVLSDTPNSGSIGFGYSPGHITSIFEVHKEHNNLLACGSRGIGFCLNKGVSTIVVVKKSQNKKINVFYNDRKISGRTTKSAVNYLIDLKDQKVDIYSYSDLPIGMGFGVSGAGALSTGFALKSAINLDKTDEEIINAAHFAEISNGTGLGDVIAQATGGIVLREHEGGFGFGRVRQLDIDLKKKMIMIGILNEQLKTKEVINNVENVKKINHSSATILMKFKKVPTLEDFFDLSYRFSKESNLLKPELDEIIKKIHNSNAGLASMVMLGNTIFSIGVRKEIVKILNNYCHQVLECKVSFEKAKKLDSLG